MGLQINLQHASWLAYILAHEEEIPPVTMLGEDADHAAAVFHQFVGQLTDGFYSGRGHEKIWRTRLERMQRSMSAVHGGDQRAFFAAVLDVREFLRNRPWTALIIPSGRKSEFDWRLCDRDFLRHLVQVRPDDDGLILQLERPPEEELLLSGLFPAFRTALTSANEWPGILVWRPRANVLQREGFFARHEVQFFPLRENDSALGQAAWLLNELAELSPATDSPTPPGARLPSVAQAYRREFGFAQLRSAANTTIIQLSDVHVGSRAAQLRLARLPSLVRQIMREGGQYDNYVIAVSGDMMDTPGDENLAQVRLFLESLAHLTKQPLITCWGNHDVRRDGMLDQKLSSIVQFLSTGAPVRSFCDGRLGIVTFNSVAGGHVARGWIGEQQLADVGNLLEHNGDYENASLIGILHHHPVSVAVPAWYKREFYERILGSWLQDKSDQLKDADRFIKFLEARNFGCVLHGHKHIPHINTTRGNVAVFGCGSSVGKVPTQDGSPYVSVNVVSFDPDSRRLTARLLAERVDGGGLREQDRAEILRLGVMRSKF